MDFNGLHGDFLIEGGWVDRFGKYLDFMTKECRRIDYEEAQKLFEGL